MQPEKLIKGIHEAYTTETKFWDNRSHLIQEKKPLTILNEEVPLRGLVHCFCGKPLTAGNSKGKTKYYWYYKCMDHVNINLSAIKMHQQFDELLEELSMGKFHLDYLYNKAEEEMNAEIKWETKKIKAAAEVAYRNQ